MAQPVLWQLATGQGFDPVGQYQQGQEYREQQDIKNNRKSVLSQLALGPDGNLDAKAGLTQLVRAGDLTGAAQFAQTSKMLQPETTDEIKEYNLYRQQGGPASFTDWKIAIKTASAPKINNVINNQENKYANKLAENDAERFIGINKTAQEAIPRLNTLKTLENITNDPNFYSGAGAEWNQKFNKALVAIGAGNPKAASAADYFTSLANQLTLDANNGKLGAGVSNADVAFLQSINPNLSTTREGNQQIIQYQRAITQRQQQVAKLARDYAKNNGGRLDVGFYDYLAQWAEKNPLFKGAPQTQAAPQFDPRAIEAEMRRRKMLE